MNLSELVPIAVGIAMNPPAVIAVIVLLSSAHPRRNAGAFVAGWVFGLFVAGAIALALGDALTLLDGSQPWVIVLKLLAGIALLVLAFGAWRRSRRSDGAKETPGWMRSLTGFSASKAFLTAALFAGLNPKTLALNVAGMLTIAEADLALAAQLVAVAAFVVLASITVAGPLAYQLVAPKSAGVVLGSFEGWLVDNSSIIGAAVLLVLGLVIVSGAVETLVAIGGLRT